MSHPNQKHPCPDCRQCQWCSEDRCRLCLRTTAGCRKKLSLPEQIALYEALNDPDGNNMCRPSADELPGTPSNS